MAPMTETTLKVQLKELTTVRIVCRNKGCGGILEIPIEKLTTLSKDGSFQCPMCEQNLMTNLSPDPLVMFGLMIQKLSALNQYFSLEFPIRDDDTQR